MLPRRIIKNLEPIYKSMNNLSKSLKGEDKSLIGFVGHRGQSNL